MVISVSYIIHQLRNLDEVQIDTSRAHTFILNQVKLINLLEIHQFIIFLRISWHIYQ